jgi:hypothetical protein
VSVEQLPAECIAIAINMTRAARPSASKVCKSACTLLIGIRIVRVERSATLLFHAGHDIAENVTGPDTRASRAALSADDGDEIRKIPTFAMSKGRSLSRGGPMGKHERHDLAAMAVGKRARGGGQRGTSKFQFNDRES